jgi:hypothetical protein
MGRTVPVSGLPSTACRPGPLARLPRTHAARWNPAKRWPPGIGLSLALFMSLALWAGIISGVLTLLGRS